MEDISALIPAGLREADELLTRYGRWAMRRHSKRRCASAEGMYRIPPNDDDRQPREVLLPLLDALAVQRALYRVPDLQRVVLAILYVPQRRPPQALLRIMRIPPRLSCDRHITGLRCFWNLYRMAERAIESAPPDAGSATRQPQG